jgi:formate hydrogenlyase subunit 6/NADH:ubiquinone oxidoreductase subunit I
MNVEKRVKKHPSISRDYCVACGCCVIACPKKAIEIVGGMFAKVNEELCVGCGKCEKVCPASVIKMEVDYDK